ncbi:hypothetical protein HII13_004992 [Brettanomyces bruxellensis]|uniref:DEBR0S6_10176g1_1 n=1 Tax=Dekkera bruxellensis TaxID=5007 RepID=A0A7D9D0C1_DEKBR|nr:hypothetical protein HII13_004992 [Brettanomyces bruxellensis]VUG20198.1 DEBR0S6_10176g1_1 [Brettanomyces bruxellensis]
MIQLPPHPESSLDRNKLGPIVKKIIGKTKGQHALRFDQQKKMLVAAFDQAQPGTLFLEAPMILLPDFELLRLIKLGKCCAYCGSVIKGDNEGRLAGTDTKPANKKASKEQKIDRFISGLDCDQCSLRWCSDVCKNADCMHNILNHRPENKSCSHQFVGADKKKKDILLFDKWHSLWAYVAKERLELCYYGIGAILRIYYDQRLEAAFESLRCVSECTEKSMIEYLCSCSPTLDEQKLRKCHVMLVTCFKKMELSFERFVRYLTIYKMNNFSGCIYLLASSLEHVNVAGSEVENCRIEYSEDDENRDLVDSLLLKPISEHSVELIQESHIEDKSKKVVFFTVGGAKVRRKILKVSNIGLIRKGEPLTIREMDYSVPTVEEYAICAVDSDGEGEIVMPNSSGSMSSHRHRSFYPRHCSNSFTSARRTASFTSSGSSFGEGIIKYNRDQIREMLQHLSLEEEQREGAERRESAGSANVLLEVPSNFGRIRSKSVHFSDGVVR